MGFRKLMEEPITKQNIECLLQAKYPEKGSPEKKIPSYPSAHPSHLFDLIKKMT
jgi:hypothetical protein